MADRGASGTVGGEGCVEMIDVAEIKIRKAPNVPDDALEVGMTALSDGTWFYEGQPVERSGIVHAVLWRLMDAGYEIRKP